MANVTNIRIPKGADAFAHLLPLLEGRVFHVTRLSNLPLILACGELRPNSDKSFATSFHMTDVSFFVNRGCVCLFDYRDVPADKFQASLLKCSPTQALTRRSGVAIFLISAERYPHLRPWTDWKQEFEAGTSKAEMVVPYVEAGHPGPIPLAMIDQIFGIDPLPSLGRMCAPAGSVVLPTGTCHRTRG